MSEQAPQQRSLLYRAFRAIPIFGAVIGIVNAYAYRGDLAASKRFAGVAAYVKVFWRPFLISLILTAATLNPWVRALLCGADPFSIKLSQFASSPGSLAVSVLPNVLGFGIGVYALVFSIPERLVRDMDEALKKAIESGRRKRGSVLVLNVDLGYPLIVLTITIAVGVLQQIFSENPWMIAVCWFLFWYSIISIIEIVGVLFHLGDHAILEKR